MRAIPIALFFLLMSQPALADRFVGPDSPPAGRPGGSSEPDPLDRQRAAALPGAPQDPDLVHRQPLSALPDGPAEPDLDLEPPAHQAVTVEEAKLKTARGLHLPSKWLGLALVTPLSVAGISLTASSTIALAAGDDSAHSIMRSSGLGLMGGGFASGILVNALARTTRLLTGGQWHEDLVFFVAGIAAGATGYVLSSAASSGAFRPYPGATEGLMVSGAVVWNVGMALLVIDAVVTGFGNDARVAEDWRPGQARLAGIWLVPTGPGATAGLTLAF